MPNRLRKIEYDRIDRVEEGAQPSAHITLVKRRRQITKQDPNRKEQSMPPIKKTDDKTPDLSALDEATRTSIEAALAERDKLYSENESLAGEVDTFKADKKAFDEAVAAASKPAVEEDDIPEDLSTIEGLDTAIAKSKKDPQRASLLKAMKAERVQAKKDREQLVALQKDARMRIFKERAQAVSHIAAHAKTDESDDDGVTALAKHLEVIDEKCGGDVANAVEAILTKAHRQTHELLDHKGLLKSVGRTGAKVEGGAVVLGDADDPAEQINEKVAALKKSKPDLTDAQAMTQVLKDNPHLYAAAQAQ